MEEELKTFNEIETSKELAKLQLEKFIKWTEFTKQPFSNKLVRKNYNQLHFQVKNRTLSIIVPWDTLMISKKFFYEVLFLDEIDSDPIRFTTENQLALYLISLERKSI